MKSVRILSLAVVALVAFSCDKDDDNNNNNNGTNATTFKVRMTDAPGNFSAMNLNITKVDAMVDGEWVNLSNTSQNVSVLELTNGDEEIVANDNTAETGHYTQLRFTIGAGNTIMINDESGQNTFDVNMAVGASSEVIVAIDENIESGDDGSVLIDFNVANSITSALGAYWMNPAMAWIEDENTGVRGDVNGASQAAITFTGQNGDTYRSFIDGDGKFMIRGMENGSYTLMIQGMHDGQNTMDEMESQENVVVSSGQITNMGSITFE